MLRATTGRERDVKWCEYTQNSDRATCSHCKLEMAGSVARMKTHFNEYHAKLVVSSELPERKPKQSLIKAHIRSKSYTPAQRLSNEFLVQWVLFKMIYETDLAWKTYFYQAHVNKMIVNVFFFVENKFKTF